MAGISDDVADKLCGLVAGGLLIGGGLMFGGPGGFGIAEAFIGATGLATTILRKRRRSPEAIYARIRLKIQAGVRTQLGAESPEWAEEADAKAAVGRLADVAERITFDAGMIVGERLSREGIVHVLMMRVADDEPLFHPDTGNPIYRQILATALRETFKALETDPEFWEGLRPELDRTVLDGLDTLRRGQADLLGLTRDIDATTRRTEIKVDEILARLQALDTFALTSAREAGIPYATIISLAQRIVPGVEDVEAALRELDSAVAQLVRYTDEDKHGKNLGSFVEEVLGRARALSREGRFKEASDVTDNAFADWEREETKLQKDEEERRSKSRATSIRLLRAGYDQDLLARNPRSAAERLVRIIGLEQSDQNARYTALRSAYEELYREGWDRGTRLPIEVSIELARIGISQSRTADQRMALRNDLANALVVVGERYSEAEKIEEAIGVYRKLLREKSQSDLNISASVRHNLATILSTLGKSRYDAEKLNEARRLYQKNLTIWNRAIDGYSWAMTCFHLGMIFYEIGNIEHDRDILLKAIRTYENTLEEFTRDQHPSEWARVMNSLGCALQTLGVQCKSAAPLKESVNSYHQALNEVSLDRAPLEWAMIQNNLGNTLRNLATYEDRSNNTREAIAAYHQALKVYVRERLPLDWAMTQMNLGTALADLAELESGTELLHEAIVAYLLALEERTRPRMPLKWAQTKENLACAHFAWFRKTGELAQLDAALEAVDGALEVYRAAALDIGRATCLRAAIISGRGG